MANQSATEVMRVIPLNDLVRRAGQLVTIPEAYYRLKEYLDQPQPDFEIVTRIIESDTALTARLLRLVNSPLYAVLYRRRVDRVFYAVQLSGIHTLKNLVLTTAISDALRRLSLVREKITEFWHHSVFSGLVATQLAKRCQILHPDRLLVAGMIHDIGHLVIYHGHARSSIRAMPAAEDDGQICTLDAERGFFGYTHCDVGCALLQLWQLPTALCDVAAWHHEPQRAESSQLDVSLIHIANAISNQAGITHHMGYHDAIIDPWAWQLIGLDESIVSTIIEEANEQFRETLKILKPD